MPSDGVCRVAQMKVLTSGDVIEHCLDAGLEDVSDQYVGDAIAMLGMFCKEAAEVEVSVVENSSTSIGTSQSASSA